MGLIPTLSLLAAASQGAAPTAAPRAMELALTRYLRAEHVQAWVLVGVALATVGLAIYALRRWGHRARGFAALVGVAATLQLTSATQGVLRGSEHRLDVVLKAFAADPERASLEELQRMEQVNRHQGAERWVGLFGLLGGALISGLAARRDRLALAGFGLAAVLESAIVLALGLAATGRALAYYRALALFRASLFGLA